jgi:hypothetical protein
MSQVNALSAPRARTRTILIVALLAATAVLCTGSGALAAEPTGSFAVFKQCPRFTNGVNFCVFSQTNSGEVTLNKQTVPISHTITLQGGVIRDETTEAETFVGALNGETLSKTPEPVPGGLASLIKCNEIPNLLERLSCELVFQNGLTGVNAVTELAKPASAIAINKNNLVNSEGIALSLPVKIHLENPLLGSECYIGSNTHPITWNFTTGTTTPPEPNKPITGSPGQFEFNEEFTYVKITNNKLVDNEFAAPGASGCGGLFAFLLDPIIDGKIGLPSAAGQNTAILNSTIHEATATAVIASEK